MAGDRAQEGDWVAGQRPLEDSGWQGWNRLGLSFGRSTGWFWRFCLRLSDAASWGFNKSKVGAHPGVRLFLPLLFSSP